MSAMIASAPRLQGAAGARVGTSSGGQFRDMIPKGYRLGQLGRFDPQQQQQFSSLFSHVEPDSWLGKIAGGDMSEFEGMEEPAWRDYQGALGQLGSQLSKGGFGKSSGAQNLKTQAAQDFAMGLKSQRSDLRQKAIKELFEMSNMLLGQQSEDRRLFEKAPKSPSFLKQLGMNMIPGIGGLGGSLFGKLF